MSVVDSGICEKQSENVNSQVNLARRQGVAVSTETKYGAGGNTQVILKSYIVEKITMNGIVGNIGRI